MYVVHFNQCMSSKEGYDKKCCRCFRRLGIFLFRALLDGSIMVSSSHANTSNGLLCTDIVTGDQDEIIVPLDLSWEPSF